MVYPSIAWLMEKDTHTTDFLLTVDGHGHMSGHRHSSTRDTEDYFMVGL